MNDASRFRRFLVVRDDFYDDPNAVRAVARSWRFAPQRDLTGYRTRRLYHPPGIRRRLELILGAPILGWNTTPANGNGAFYLSPARGRMREIPGVHYDSPETEVTVLVYLTPGLPEDSGTSLWQHRATGLDAAPTLADARRLNTGLRALRTHLERDSVRRPRWIEIDRVGYRFNRLVAYPSALLHSATRHYGSTPDDARIYQTFRIQLDWEQFRIHR